ncbi:MAG: hypothetical protein CBC83_07900 [Flavobacteriales bacterium TMED123]|nr:MAG: hypothetical protein CBC83_07900 [Flavobacteriales bacterium TMED123]|tara:strand:- start:32 stop:457 length:426 start_codon:yes stop_codon:yes gene_type:complete
MKDNWKKLQNDKVVNSDPVEKKINHLKKVINDPDGYNTNLASKDRVKELEQKVDELADISHTPTNFTEKLQKLHNKIDSIYSIMETLSDRLNTLEYTGIVRYGDKYSLGKHESVVKVTLNRKEDKDNSPNPYGDDDFATPT